jgi:hypothetical protein
MQGTWQFISTARLLDPSAEPHRLSDDLESFFWVLLYEVFRCCKDGSLSDMQNVFDQFTNMDGKGIIKGGKGKLSCL